MRNLIFAIPLCCLLASTALAEPTEYSLFFSPDEVSQIETLAAKTPRAAANTGDVYLDAIFYYAADNWVLWLRGQKWTPSTTDPDVQVMDVKPDEVRLHVSMAGSEIHDVTLKPHQTFQLSTGKVVEGSGASATPVDFSR